MQQVIRFVALIAVAGFTLPAFGETCAELEEAYYHQDKIYSFMGTLLGDKGRPERHSGQINALNQKVIILKFMDKQNCPYPAVVKRNYSSAAEECRRSREGNLFIAILHGKELTEEPVCNMSEWQPNEEIQ